MKKIGGIQAITFDVGGTLIEPWPSVGHVYAQVGAEHGVTGLEPEWVDRRFASAWKAKKDFDYSKEAWAELVDKALARPGFSSGRTPFFDALYQRFTEADAWRLYDDVWPVLNRLRELDWRLGVISNWDERLRPLLTNLDLDQYFEVIVVSREAGAHKPESRIFHEAVQQFGVEPRGVLHVGDSEWEDARGAAEAGLRAVLVNRKPGGGAGRLGSLWELEGLLGGATV